MPAKSEKQQRLMGMALAAKRDKGQFSEKIKRISESMTEKQLRDFASTKHAKLSEKRAMVELIKWAIENNMSPVPTSGPGMPHTAPYLGPTSGPGVINAAKKPVAGRVAGAMGRVVPGVAGVADAFDASDRAAHGDNTGAWISRVGALGGAAAMVPHPMTKYIGTGVSMGAGAINAFRDRNGAYGGRQVAQQPQAEPQPEPNQAPQEMLENQGEQVAQEPQEPLGTFAGADYAQPEEATGSWEPNQQAAQPQAPVNTLSTGVNNMVQSGMNGLRNMGNAAGQNFEGFRNKMNEYAQRNPDFQQFLASSGFGGNQPVQAPSMNKTSELIEALKHQFRKHNV